jgi:acetyl-CoA acyltransferase
MTAALIVDVIRTASGKGKPGGQLSGIHPADLLSRYCEPWWSATTSTRS